MDKWSWILLLGGIAIGGVVVYLFLRPVYAPTTSSPLYTYKVKPTSTVLENEETWDMKELSDGSIRVTVHRKVKR